MNGTAFIHGTQLAPSCAVKSLNVSALQHFLINHSQDTPFQNGFIVSTLLKLLTLKADSCGFRNICWFYVESKGSSCCPMGNFSTIWVTVLPLSSVEIVTVYSSSCVIILSKATLKKKSILLYQFSRFAVKEIRKLKFLLKCFLVYLILGT